MTTLPADVDRLHPRPGAGETLHELVVFLLWIVTGRLAR
jgi:hypothetical protein